MVNNRFNSIPDSIMAAIVTVTSATGETIEARSLLSAEGIRWIYTNVEYKFVHQAHDRFHEGIALLHRFGILPA